MKKTIMTAQKSAKTRSRETSSPLNLDTMSPDLVTLDRIRDKMKKLGITGGDVRDEDVFCLPHFQDLLYNDSMKTAFLFIFAFALVTLTACAVTRNIAVEMPPASAVSIYDGKIVGLPFVNKVGQENPKIIDLYFETGGKKYFIKFLDSNVSRNEVLQYVNKSLKVQGKVNYGLWDTNDPNHQSRVGEYIVIEKIGDR